MELDGYGDGDGDGYGSGYGYGDGYGSGSGSGDGYGEDPKEFLKLIGDKLDARWVLKDKNAELRRMMIEAMGSDRFFSQLETQVLHKDLDIQGNPRTLLKFNISDAQAGYLLAVRVVCPTTGRIYHLGVPPTVKTCAEAVASTFNLRAKEYSPKRES
jgi:hypothetical protein